MGDDFFKDTIDNLFLGVCIVDKNRKISYWNKGAENLTGLATSEVINKSFKLAGENCPIMEALNDGEIKTAKAYLSHKNGRKVHISFKISPNRNTNGEIIGASVMFHDISSQIMLVNRIKELQESSSYDFLTQLPNRWLFEKTFRAKMEEMHRTGKVFGIIFVDVDNFKTINDAYGHDMGDLVLKMVSKRLLTGLRPYDILSRWGGEEFVALVPHVNREQLHVIASRLRSMIERMSVFTGESVIKVTISAGATLSRPDDSTESLIRRADKLMYQSKTTGKNKITVEVAN